MCDVCVHIKSSVIEDNGNGVYFIDRISCESGRAYRCANGHFHRITSHRIASKRSIFIQIISSAIDRDMQMFNMHADKNNMNSISLVRMSSRNAIRANNALHSAAYNVNSFEFHTS